MKEYVIFGGRRRFMWESFPTKEKARAALRDFGLQEGENVFICWRHVGKWHVERTPGAIMLNEVELSVRAYNVLCVVVDDMFGVGMDAISASFFARHVTDRDLYTCRNCGRKTIAEIRYALEQLGLSLIHSPHVPKIPGEEWAKDHMGGWR